MRYREFVMSYFGSALEYRRGDAMQTEEALIWQFNEISGKSGILEWILSLLASYYANWEHDAAGAILLRDDPKAFLQYFRTNFPEIQVADGVRLIPLHTTSGGPTVYIGDLHGRPHFAKKMADRLMRAAAVYYWRELVREELRRRGLEVRLPTVEFVKRRVRMIMDAFKRDSLVKLAAGGVGSGPIAPAHVIRELDFPQCSYVVPLSVVYGVGTVIVTRADLVHGRPRKIEGPGDRAQLHPAHRFRTSVDGGAAALIQHLGVDYRVAAGKVFGSAARSIVRMIPSHISTKIEHAIRQVICGSWAIPTAAGRILVDSRPSSPRSKKGGHIIVISFFPF
jgi:hypothetical protein